MTNNDKSLEEAKKLNQQSRQGSMTSSASSTDYNSPDTQEARQLNSQAGSGSTMASSTNNSANLTSSTSSSLQETKDLNAKSRQNKGK
ncbi:hypothetical protein [Candidatus Clostridium radicumherbarum]